MLYHNQVFNMFAFLPPHTMARYSMTGYGHFSRLVHHIFSTHYTCIKILFIFHHFSQYIKYKYFYYIYLSIIIFTRNENVIWFDPLCDPHCHKIWLKFFLLPKEDTGMISRDGLFRVSLLYNGIIFNPSESHASDCLSVSEKILNGLQLQSQYIFLKLSLNHNIL